MMAKIGRFLVKDQKYEFPFYFFNLLDKMKYIFYWIETRNGQGVKDSLYISIVSFQSLNMKHEPELLGKTKRSQEVAVQVFSIQQKTIYKQRLRYKHSLPLRISKRYKDAASMFIVG